MKAVITGMGVASPTGLGAEEHWTSTLAGKNAIGPVSRFDASRYAVRLAGELPLPPIDGLVPRRLLPQTDRVTRISLAAAAWALEDAGVDPTAHSAFDMGVVTASGAGGFEFGQRELQKLWGKGSEHVSAYQSFAWFYAVNTGQISIRHGFQGPAGVLVSEQAGGLDALAQARRRLREGTELVLAGGVEAPICPWGWAALTTRDDISTVSDPQRAYLPFDRGASGHIPGEGGALFVVEHAASAERHGRGIHGIVAGHGATFDPPPGSGRPPGLRRAMELALADAGKAPEEVDVVFADGAGTLGADRREALAIDSVFGARRTPVPVTVPKTMTGRLSAGGAALDVATALLCVRDGVIPPTVNVDEPVGVPGLDLVLHSPRRAEVSTALVLARGRGGFNSALVLCSPDG